MAIGTLAHPRHTIVAKKQSPESQDRPAGKQVNFRADESLYSRLEVTSESLGLDVSNLVRMILKENLPAYERRAREVDGGDNR